MERARSKMTSTILNTSADALIAVSGSGQIQALNNQAYRTFQLSSQSDFTGHPVEEVCPALKWKDVVETGREREEVIQWKDRKLYTEYRPVLVDKMGKPSLLPATQSRLWRQRQKSARALQSRGLRPSIPLTTSLEAVLLSGKIFLWQSATAVWIPMC